MAKKLFLDTEETGDKRPVRILYCPHSRENNSMMDFLSSNTKDTLQYSATPFLALMKKYRFRFDCGGGKTEVPPIIEKFETSKSQPKAEWTQLLALFFDRHNYAVIFDDMPQCEIDVHRETLRNHFLIDSDVERIMGKKCFKKQGWWCDKKQLVEPLNFYFNSVYCKADTDKSGQGRDCATFIRCGQSRQQFLLMHFFPDQAELKGMDTLPEDKGLKRYNGENNIFAKLPILASLYDGKLLPHSLGKLTASVLKKAQKMLALDDFFQTYPDSKQPQISTALMLNYYVFYRQNHGRKKQAAQPEQLVKEIIEVTFLLHNYNAFTLSVLMPYIRGVKRERLESYKFEYVINILIELLKAHHSLKWLSVEQLIMGLRTYDKMADTCFVLIESYDIDYQNMRNSYIENENGHHQYIHPGNIVRQLSEPFVKALLFTLSTFGIVEVAYREPQAGDTSYYDGLRYVRLTELGKYAFGISMDYTPQLSVNGKSVFCLDDQRLLIKVQDEHSPFLSLLGEFATSITPSLYRVSYESFLSGCSSRFDVDRKVSMFGQYVCNNLPVVWRQFMDDVTRRCNPLGVPDDKYVLLTIPKDNTELQRLMLTEPSIRRYVLKAENYMLLVKQGDMTKLINALKKFGYLV